MDTTLRSNLIRYLFPSYFVRKFIPLEEEKEKVKFGSEEWKNSVAKIYVNNLVKADKISNAFGAKFIAFFQPTLYYKDILSPEEKKRIIPVRGEHYIDMRRRILSQIEIAGHDSETKIIDLSDIYDDLPDRIFVDSAHTRQEAKRIVAQEIYNNIIEHIEIVRTTGSN